eukprot:UN17919
MVVTSLPWWSNLVYPPCDLSTPVFFLHYLSQPNVFLNFRKRKNARKQ